MTKSTVRKAFLPAAVLAALLPFTSYAQEKLTGVVIEENEKGTFLPVAGASVYWLGTMVAAQTDSDGVFTIPWEPGRKQLVVSFIGFSPDTVEIHDNRKVTVLLKETRQLKVDVIYRRKSTSTAFLEPVNTQLISEQELFKAACCNLAESFETTPSVDVAFTDALTGTREIKMLGLAGKYAFLSRENMPGLRGLASIQGLSLVPGTWIQSIQLSKGTGSVVNGFESISGQINYELRKENTDDRLLFNGYASQEGRFETNVVTASPLNKKRTWFGALLLHASDQQMEFDKNKDGFLDIPKKRQFAVGARWLYQGKSGFHFHGMIFGNTTNTLARQKANGWYIFSSGLDRFEGWMKIGYFFPQKKYKSIGLQFSGTQSKESHGFVEGYAGIQRSLYSNLIYQSIIGTTLHKFKTGCSIQFDNVLEDLFQIESDSFFLAKHNPDVTSGLFYEYTYDYLGKLIVVAGLRTDFHNYYNGFFITPRLHIRADPGEGFILRLSGGRGQRTPRVVTDNLGLLVSSRWWRNTTEQFPEIAWNTGASLAKTFELDYREGELRLDYYYTWFESKLVTDVDSSPQAVYLYNSFGGSYSNSFQAELLYELRPKLDVKLSYRWFEVLTHYSSGWLMEPLVARHRFFANAAWERKKWMFDGTVQWIGPKRLPSTAGNPEPYRLPGWSPGYWLANGQVTRKVGKWWEIYLGAENIFDFRQDNPILAASDPFGPYFDASMIWGPVFGRMAYSGFRYRVKAKIDN